MRSRRAAGEPAAAQSAAPRGQRQPAATKQRTIEASRLPHAQRLRCSADQRGRRGHAAPPPATRSAAAAARSAAPPRRVASACQPQRPSASARRKASFGCQGDPAGWDRQRCAASGGAGEVGASVRCTAGGDDDDDGARSRVSSVSGWAMGPDTSFVSGHRVCIMVSVDRHGTQWCPCPVPSVPWRVPWSAMRSDV